MYADFYVGNPLLFWPLAGLVIFLVSFAAVLAYIAVGLREREKLEYLAALPLEADGGDSPESEETQLVEGEKGHDR